MYKKVLVVTDNLNILGKFRGIVKNSNIKGVKFTYKFSETNKEFKKKFKNKKTFSPISVKGESEYVVNSFDLIISAHSKQIFPDTIVNHVKCINIHPGLNPYNRGWYPQVFSIINKLPIGATIHEMDEKIDHGPIIAQKEVEVNVWDTSYTVYNKVVSAEMDLLRKNIKAIIDGAYSTKKANKEGNINLKTDFEKLCLIDLEARGRFVDLIDRLRALTHGDYKNAFFYDGSTGKKIYVSIILEPKDDLV